MATPTTKRAAHKRKSVDPLFDKLLAIVQQFEGDRDFEACLAAVRAAVRKAHAGGRKEAENKAARLMLAMAVQLGDACVEGLVA